MQHQTETQKAPAAPRRAWVTPELRSLDVKHTLSGPNVTAKEQGIYTEDGEFIGPWGGPVS